MQLNLDRDWGVLFLPDSIPVKYATAYAPHIAIHMPITVHIDN